jgi:hypothetical protein
MTTVTISPNQTTEQRASVRLPAVPSAFMSGADARRHVPFFVPRDQSYFWTQKWQQDEGEALREIAEGNVQHFTSGAAAVAWLLADDVD